MREAKLRGTAEPFWYLHHWLHLWPSGHAATWACRGLWCSLWAWPCCIPICKVSKGDEKAENVIHLHAQCNVTWHYKCKGLLWVSIKVSEFYKFNRCFCAFCQGPGAPEMGCLPTWVEQLFIVKVLSIAGQLAPLPHSHWMAEESSGHCDSLEYPPHLQMPPEFENLFSVSCTYITDLFVDFCSTQVFRSVHNWGKFVLRFFILFPVLDLNCGIENQVNSKQWKRGL